jgi:hypothetical protein
MAWLPFQPRTASATLAWSALLAVQDAGAHGFGSRYDLPIPLWLYLTGAGLTVFLSFVLLALGLRRTLPPQGPAQFDLLRFGTVRCLASPPMLCVYRALGLVAFFAIAVAGWLGQQSPLKNIAPIMVWAIWWVGTAFVSALVGNVWSLFNPLDGLYRLIEAALRRLRPGRPTSLHRHYPSRLGVWPAVALFLAFVWMELIWDRSDVPAVVAGIMLVYAGISVAGMAVFGREQWLARGEAFALVFGLLSRFAPTHFGRQRGRQTPQRSETLLLRPYAVGLLPDAPASRSMVVLVVAILATVSFDGFLETPVWLALVEHVRPSLSAFGLADDSAVDLIRTLGLLAAPVVFYAVYLATCYAIAYFAGRNLPSVAVPLPQRAGRIAGIFVFTLVPISIAYHLAHYLSFLVSAFQYLVPIVSDPLGLGWDLFGTRNRFVRPAIVDARIVWYVAVGAIVTGHVAAVYLAHLLSLREFADRRAALRSQLPMVCLMIAYTMLSLWTIGQPILTSRFG